MQVSAVDSDPQSRLDSCPIISAPCACLDIALPPAVTLEPRPVSMEDLPFSSKGHKAMWQCVFDTIGSQIDDFLSRRELSRATNPMLEVLGQTPMIPLPDIPEKQIEAIFDAYDMNKEGFLSLQMVKDLMRDMQCLTCLIMSEQRGKAIQDTHTDLTRMMGPCFAQHMSGAVSQMLDYELEVMKALSCDEIPDEAAFELLRELDADRDGVLSRDDFKRHARKVLFDPNPPEELREVLADAAVGAPMGLDDSLVIAAAFPGLTSSSPLSSVQPPAPRMEAVFPVSHPVFPAQTAHAPPLLRAPPAAHSVRSSMPAREIGRMMHPSCTLQTEQAQPPTTVILPIEQTRPLGGASHGVLSTVGIARGDATVGGNMISSSVSTACSYQTYALKGARAPAHAAGNSTSLTSGAASSAAAAPNHLGKVPSRNMLHADTPAYMGTAVRIPLNPQQSRIGAACRSGPQTAAQPPLGPVSTSPASYLPPADAQCHVLQSASTVNPRNSIPQYANSRMFMRN